MKQLTWPAVALVAIIGGVGLGLASFTSWQPGEILGFLGVLGGIGGGAAVAGSVSGRVEQIAAETSEQSGTLETIKHKVNGDLDARMAGHVAAGNAALLAELERRKVRN